MSNIIAQLTSKVDIVDQNFEYFNGYKSEIVNKDSANIDLKNQKV